MDKVLAAIGGIQEHNDHYTKSILIGGERERVGWVHFDIAIVYEVDSFGRGKGDSLPETETDVVKRLGRLLVSCHLRPPIVQLTKTITSKPISQF